jgi:peptidoglycan/LPS O-acetylase OafA/YrhL
MTASTYTKLAAWIGVGFFVFFGGWAFVAPESFYDNIAEWPPYNEHFLHDAGAFQVGLGAVLLLAVLGWSTLATALGGVAVGAVLHAVAHIIDSGDGGRDSDPVGLSLLAVVLVVAAVLARTGDRVRQETSV